MRILKCNRDRMSPLLLHWKWLFSNCQNIPWPWKPTIRLMVLKQLGLPNMIPRDTWPVKKSIYRGGIFRLPWRSWENRRKVWLLNRKIRFACTSIRSPRFLLLRVSRRPCNNGKKHSRVPDGRMSSVIVRRRKMLPWLTGRFFSVGEMLLAMLILPWLPILWTVKYYVPELTWWMSWQMNC